MNSQILGLSDTIALITAQECLSIAGPEALLAQLPRGAWIGGTTAFAMTPNGSQRLENCLCVTRFSEATAATVRHLPTPALPTIGQGYVPGGLSLVLIPAFSKAHAAFATDSRDYPGLFDQPLMGWVSGVAVDENGPYATAVFDGATGLRHVEGALVMHLALPAGSMTSLDIENRFTPSRDPATTFRFPETGFTATTVMLGSRSVNLARHIVDRGLDVRLPLITNAAGTLINVAIQSVDPDKGEVSFRAPVVEGAVYNLAHPLTDRPAITAQADPALAKAYGCGDIEQHLFGNSPTQGSGGFTGPLCFGQIAYILLNQTVVTLDIATA